ncbi:hypothetical protein [Kitasatospora sp. GAS204B]|uniref:hypothetical protein n=1 Tax=unclassified Kitasatospora TaxID=2633591 RepID=UPI00247663EE|nr:hypothetical protein [Kitasatospora sp. GAS204B]MDH6119791.1 hypothetical protein [Kitasatospora sp. GAS204B]
MSLQGALQAFFGQLISPTCFTLNLAGCIANGAVTTLSGPIASFLTYLQNGASQATAFNPADQGFIAQYDFGLGISLFVLVIILMRVFYRHARYPERSHQTFDSLFHYLPITILMWGSGPAIGVVLEKGANALTNDVIRFETTNYGYLYTDITGMIAGAEGVSSYGDPLTGVPSLVIALIIVLIILLVVCIAVILQLAVLSIALWMTGTVMAIAFVMMIDPELRARAIKLPYIWIGAAFGKPLLFFLLGSMAAFIHANSTSASPGTGTGTSASAVAKLAQPSAATSGEFTSLVKLLMVTIALLIIALAPMSLMKYAPLLPGGGEEIGAHAGAAVAGAITGQVSSLAGNAQVSYAQELSSGAGGGHHEGGGTGGGTGGGGGGGPSAGASAAKTASKAGSAAFLPLAALTAAMTVAQGASNLANSATSGLPGSE